MARWASCCYPRSTYHRIQYIIFCDFSNCSIPSYHNFLAFVLKFCPPSKILQRWSFNKHFIQESIILPNFLSFLLSFSSLSLKLHYSLFVSLVSWKKKILFHISMCLKFHCCVGVFICVYLFRPEDLYVKSLCNHCRGTWED